MASTLLVGAHVVVERETLRQPLSGRLSCTIREVHRGDIVVFYKPTRTPWRARFLV